jgi:hypothetical protein
MPLTKSWFTAGNWGCTSQNHCSQLEFQDAPCKLIVCSQKFTLNIQSLSLYKPLVRTFDFISRPTLPPFMGSFVRMSVAVCVVAFWLCGCLRPFAWSYFRLCGCLRPFAWSLFRLCGCLRPFVWSLLGCADVCGRSCARSSVVRMSAAVCEARSPSRKTDFPVETCNLYTASFCGLQFKVFFIKFGFWVRV